MNNYVAMAGIWLFIFIIAVLVLDFTLVHLVAKAARMKNRSYKAFWWLSFFFRPTILALIVASLPFNNYDPRSPLVKVDTSIEDQVEYKNPYSSHKLVDTYEKGLLVISSIVVVVSLFGGLIAVGQGMGILPQQQASSAQDTSAITCTKSLTQADINLEYTDWGNCLAYRYWTDSERNANSCTANYCLDMYVKALSTCKIVKFTAELDDDSGTAIKTINKTIKNLKAGKVKKIQLTNDVDWSNSYVLSLTCDGV